MKINNNDTVITLHKGKISILQASEKADKYYVVDYDNKPEGRDFSHTDVYADMINEGITETIARKIDIIAEKITKYDGEKYVCPNCNKTTYVHKDAIDIGAELLCENCRDGYLVSLSFLKSFVKRNPQLLKDEE